MGSFYVGMYLICIQEVDVAAKLGVRCNLKSVKNKIKYELYIFKSTYLTSFLELVNALTVMFVLIYVLFRFTSMICT